MICLAALLLRLFTIAQSPTFAPEAYETMRQVEHIRETGLPLVNDPLSAQSLRPLPLFPYLVAFGTLFMPTNLAYALIPNILAVLLHAAIFFLALELTNNRSLAIIAAIGSVFVPNYLTLTTLTVSSLSLAIPLLFFILTLFIKLRKSKVHRGALLALTIALLASHPISLLLAVVLLLALILSTVRRVSGLAIQYEYAVFATILIVWFHLLFYRDIILLHGLAAIKGNLPAALAPQIYGSPTLAAIGVTVGVVPLALALYAGYREGVAKHPGIQTNIALAAATILGITLKLLPTAIGATLFACACIPLAAVGLQHLRTYERTLHVRWITVLGISALVITFMLTNLLATVVSVGSITESAISDDAIKAARWIQENSLPQSVVLADPIIANMIMLEANRAVFIDTKYTGEVDANERYDLSETILRDGRYPRNSRTAKIDYIILKEPIRDDCLNTVYNKEYSVQKTLCR